MNVYFFVILLMLLCAQSVARPDTLFYSKDGYDLESIHDDVKPGSVLYISRSGNPADKIVFEDRITNIKSYDLSGKGIENIIIDVYSGGAHCCFTMLIADFNGGKLIFRDSIYWGNSLYEIKDVNGDGILEIIGDNDALVDSFTSYELTEFPLMIYNYIDGNVILSNNEFPEIVGSDIAVLMERLKSIKYFKCPDRGESTFYTDAGKVKGILAAIVWNYYTIGDTEKGYDFLDKIYNCPDKEDFISILRNDFNLK